ncbi:hypothetical protein RPD76_07560 [Methylomonas sp. MV1]|uniref:hypothetical protein n=1 Tax=Methylomonas sp. MV1 TaxID=3073620 RepID=UPI0028A4BD08|nr:hypothetical protein [Methylomonas sp. MV1]MDT4329762.1 hypothetical protein [Methylomonas sp. MV1]
MQVKIPLEAYNDMPIVNRIQIGLVEYASQIDAARSAATPAGEVVGNFRVFSDRIEIDGYNLYFDDVENWDFLDGGMFEF